MRFTSLGTCRLAEPLMAAVDDDHIRDQTNVFGYVHAAREVLQQIDFIFGGKLPQEYAPFIASAESFPRRRKRETTDLWFVEISSLKELRLESAYLQINHVTRQFSGNKPLLDLFWRLSGEADRPERARALADIEGFADIPDVRRHMLLESYVTTATQSSLEVDILEIAERLPGQIVFVPHVNVPTKAGSYITRRVELSRYLQTIAELHNLNYFDPAPHVNQFGLERAMINGGADINHYTPEFTSQLGRLMRTLAIDSVSEGKKLHLHSRTDSANGLSNAQNGYGLTAISEEMDIAAERATPVWEESLAGLTKSLAAARNYINSRDHNLALAVLRDIEQSSIANLEYCVLYARTLAAVGDNVKRTRIGDEIMSRFGDNVRALAAAAQVFEKAGEDAKARAAHEAASALVPSDPRPLFRLSVIADRNSDKAAAAKYIERGIAAASANAALLGNFYKLALRSNNAEALAQIGHQAAQCDQKLAIEACHALLALEQIESAACIAARLPAELRQGELGEPLQNSLRKKFIFHRDHSAPLQCLRTATTLAGLSADQGDAAATIAKGVKVVRDAARHLSADGDHDAARSMLAEATQICLDNPVLLREYGLTCEHANDLHSALNAWSALSAIKPDVALLTRAVAVARKIQAWDRAILLQRRVLDCNPLSQQEAEKMDTLLRHAAVDTRTLLDSGQTKNAMKFILGILKEDPESVMAQSLCRKMRKLLKANIETERGSSVDEYVNMLLELDGDDFQALTMRATSLESKRDFSGAAQSWLRLAEGRSARPSHWRRLAKLYTKLGDKAAAEAANQSAEKLEATRTMELSRA